MGKINLGKVQATINGVNALKIEATDGIIAEMYEQTGVLVLRGSGTGGSGSEDTNTSETDVTIENTSWYEVTDDDIKELGYNYYTDITVDGIATDDSAVVEFDVPSLSIARKVGVSTGGAINTNKIRIYTKNKPEENLDAVVIVTKKNS